MQRLSLCLLVIASLVGGLFYASPAVADITRTKAGKPDFSGVYDTGTLTPLNRPKQFGDKQFMTPEEANQVTAAVLGRFEFANRQSAPDRGAPKKGGDGNNTAGAGGVGGYNAFGLIRATRPFRSTASLEPQLFTAPRTAANLNSQMRPRRRGPSPLHLLVMTTMAQHRGSQTTDPDLSMARKVSRLLSVA